MRSSVLVLVISLGACTKAEPPPKADTPTSSEVQTAEPAVDPCIELAQLYCENTPVDCEQMKLLLREAEVPAASCATAAHDTRALVASMTEMDRVILPMVLNRQLALVLLDSPKLDDAKRAELQAIADGERPPAAAIGPSKVTPSASPRTSITTSRAARALPATCYRRSALHRS